MADLLGIGPKSPDLPLAPPLPPPPDADTSAVARSVNAAERRRVGRNQLIIDPALPPMTDPTRNTDLSL